MIDPKKVHIESIPVPGKNWEIVNADVRVIYDGDVCPFVEVTGELEKRYIGYEAIKNDLARCNKVLDYINHDNLDEAELQSALWESFITKYGRCFADASQGRGVKLEQNSVFKNCDGLLEEVHKSLMEGRHQFTAHAGTSENDFISGRLALMPPAKGKELVIFYIARDTVIKAQSEAISIHKNLLTHVIRFTDGKLDPIYIKIKKKYANMDIDRLYERSKYIIA